MLPRTAAQRGVCYEQTSAVRYYTIYHSRTHKETYDCSWWGWGWHSCNRYRNEVYSSQAFYTVYMRRQFCCPGYTEVRGRCTLPLAIRPSYGHLFGGTPVLVSGPYFSPTDTVTCQFGDVTLTAMYINEGSILCVSPMLEKIGETPLIVYVVATDGVTRYDSTFNTISPDRAHVVDINSESPTLMLEPVKSATITWTPEDVTPSYLPATTNVNIDITSYKQEYTQNEGEWKVNWESATVLALSVPVEDREVQVFIPPLALNCRLPLHDNTRSVDVGLCPVIIKVSVSDNEGELSLPNSVGLWSGVMFMKSSFSFDNFRDVCTRWSGYEMDSGVTGQSLLQRVIPCPPTQALARNDRSFEEERMTSLFRATSYSQKAMVFFHSGVTSCYRQFTPNFDGVGQQCCYGPIGNLMKGETSGGSVDTMSPKFNYNRHLSDDVLPYIYCCKGETGSTKCNEYYKWRPSGQEIQYRLPLPACIFGDPHIITLDGLKYTFNGKGEFTMIETSDNSFTLQGRMETILNSDGTPTLGTVFTALVAREESTNTTVQFNLQGNGAQVHVNHRIINFDDVNSEIIKENVTVASNAAKSFSAVFKLGAKMEIKVENGIISVMLITLPNSLKGKTRGLMGTFNEDTSDDLVPKSEEKAIPSNSSLEDIHYMFGMTWILKSASESLFTYNAGESFILSYDPNFNPVFETTFKNADLEDKAREVCGNDEYCLFDIATTNNVKIGMATMRGVESFDEMVEMAVPIVCDPPCVNGACVQNNNCSCNEGYEGDTCDVSVVSACDTNICENNGVCVKHVLTYTCNCPNGYIGDYCEEKEPPFQIRLINSSPRVSEGRVIVDFEPTMPLLSAECFLIGGRGTDCTEGHVQYDNIPAGSHIFLIHATSELGEKFTVRRTIHIGESGDEQFCAVHLINEGVIVDGRTASIFFKGTEAVDSYLCKLSSLDSSDNANPSSCRSPVRYQDLEIGEYRVQVLPVGCDSQGKKLSTKFNIY
ncbi:sushi domain-containing protein 2-like isoform X2 [Halichondria panicea]